MGWLRNVLGQAKGRESVRGGIAWTRSGYLISTDPLRQNEAALSVDPFVALPFELTLPARWRHGLHEGAPRAARNVVADAAFVAHDPESTDPAYRATVTIRASEGVTNVDASFNEQERIFREGMASDASLRSSDLRRVVLPAGEALRLLLVAEEMQLQYYLRTPGFSFEIWFTAPGEELPEREAEFDAMAQSFRLRGGP